LIDWGSYGLLFEFKLFTGKLSEPVALVGLMGLDEGPPSDENGILTTLLLSIDRVLGSPFPIYSLISLFSSSSISGG